MANELFIIEYPDGEIDDSADMGGFTVFLDRRSAEDAIESCEESESPAIVRFVRDSERDALTRQNLALREALEISIKSAHPHPTEHPTMTAAWAVMRAALALPLPDAAKEVEAWREKAGLLDWWLAQDCVSFEWVDKAKGAWVMFRDAHIAGKGDTALAALRDTKGKAR